MALRGDGATVFVVRPVSFDRLHRSIVVAFLYGRAPFVSETFGSLSIRKENPTFEGAFYAPADNSPLMDHFANSMT
jgi:hypothetical protein